MCSAAVNGLLSLSPPGYPTRAQFLKYYYELSFVSDLIDVIVQVRPERGITVSDRLRGISNLGHPQLLDVNWTLRMDIAKRDCPKVRKLKVIL
ncbi:unnamed protein product [Toxocara canis]|uniref:DDE_Tnp_1_7 domain-containing protein n=1 Tax=Toxocara canis TaxID=6265 RepID=A0A183VFJ9_TOXCA|nr:unnamed protein product [Toxocara canis]